MLLLGLRKYTGELDFLDPPSTAIFVEDHTFCTEQKVALCNHDIFVNTSQFLWF